jgi:hypothetical protein
MTGLNTLSSTATLTFNFFRVMPLLVSQRQFICSGITAHPVRRAVWAATHQRRGPSDE